MGRRELLSLIPASCFSILSPFFRALASDDTLHVLKPGDIERLRLDFNASRSKVRLLLLLSPT